MENASISERVVAQSPSAVGESGHVGRRDRHPTRTPIRANQIPRCADEKLPGEEHGHAGRHVVPRADGAVHVRGVVADEHRHGIGLGKRARPRPGARGTDADDDQERTTRNARMSRSNIAPLVSARRPARVRAGEPSCKDTYRRERPPRRRGGADTVPDTVADTPPSPCRASGTKGGTPHHFASAFSRRRDGDRGGREVTGWPVDAAVAVDAKTRPRRLGHAADDVPTATTGRFVIGLADVGNVDRERVSRRSHGDISCTVRVEAGAVAEHGAGDVEQAVGHRAQRARVSVAAGA